MIYDYRMYILEAGMKVAKWGNSLAVRLSKEAVAALGVSEGDDIGFQIGADGGVRLSRNGDLKAWAESLRTYEGRLPADFKFSREDAHRRG